MKIRTIVGGGIALISTLAMPLIWISGTILHLLTAIAALILAGGPDGGFWPFFVGGAAFSFPIIAEIVVFFKTWNTTGFFLNGYSIWLLLWLGFAGLLLSFLSLAVWLSKSAEGKIGSK